MRIFFLGLLSILLCVACSEQHDHKGKTPLVELDGNFLYREDLQSALPARLSKDDRVYFFTTILSYCCSALISVYLGASIISISARSTGPSPIGSFSWVGRL